MGAAFKMGRRDYEVAELETVKAKVLSMHGYEILEIVRAENPHDAALRFGAILGADKGYSTKIRKISNVTFDCIASDNRAIRYTRQPLKM